MMLHQDGSRAAWLAGRRARPDRHDGRRDQRDLLGVPGRGGRHGLDVAGAARGVRRARAAVEPLHRPRQPLLPHAEGRRGGGQGAADPGRPGAGAAGHRAHPGLFAGGARALGADVRHAAGPAAQGAQAVRHQRDIAAANRYIREVYLPAHNARFAKPPPIEESAFVPVRDPASLADILCIEESGWSRATTRCPTRGAAAAAAEPGARPLRQGPRQGARISGRHARGVPRPATAGALQRRGRRARRGPDHCQRDTVLAAVKAWPGEGRAWGSDGATASLDRVCARRPWGKAGRDEETALRSNQETDQNESGKRGRQRHEPTPGRGVHRFRTGQVDSNPEADK